MKKTFLTCVLVITANALFSQEFKISVTPTISNIHFYHYAPGLSYGQPRFGINTNLDYLFVTNKRVEFGIGLGYQNSHVQIIVPYPGRPDYSLSTEKADLVSINLRSVLNLSKNFYLTFVPSLDLQIKHSSLQRLSDQSGLGLSVGLGNYVKLSESLALNIEPRLWVHNVIPFSSDNHPFKLTTAAINLGLVFGHKRDL
jgi:hypothetical protein